MIKRINTIAALCLLAVSGALGGVANDKTQTGNLSARGFTQTGDNILIGGFIVTGKDYVVAVIRALGPSVEVPGRLQNPTLELHGPDGALIVAQDSYLENNAADLAKLQAAGLTPSNPNECAIIRTFAPGAYTAQVRGANGTTGNALVEFYKLQ